MKPNDTRAILDQIIDCRAENRRINWKKAQQVTRHSRHELQRIYYTHERCNQEKQLVVHKWTKSEEDLLQQLYHQQNGRIKWKQIQEHFPGLSIIKLKNKMSQIIKTRNHEEEQQAIQDLNCILDGM